MAEEAAKIPEKQVAIQRIYMKDFSFESPRSPQIFSQGDVVPKTNLNLRSSQTTLSDDLHEVVLTITIDTKHEDQTLFLVELHQAGVFHLAGYEGEELAMLLGSFCPNILYPYARETIASVVGKGGFPEFILQPINFDSLYAQSRQQLAEQGAAATPPRNGEGGGNSGTN